MLFFLEYLVLLLNICLSVKEKQLAKATTAIEALMIACSIVARR